MDTGSVTCNLCNAMINVKMGNFYKYQLHMENDHDVFHDQDLLMALSFLKMEEKEVIITKVLPRMKELLDAAVILTEKKALNSPFLIHKKLSEYEASIEEYNDPKDEESTNDNTNDNINNSIKNVASTSKIEIKFSQLIQQQENEDTNKLNLIEENDKPTPKITPAIDTPRITLETEIPKIIPNSVKKEVTTNKVIKENEDKSDKVIKKDLNKTPVLLKCPVCKSLVKKYKFNMHKNNCIIMQRLKEKKQFNNAKLTSNKNDKNEKVEPSSKNVQATKEKLSCYYCDKEFTLKSSLERHKTWSHSTQ